jgi:hypothetical protein
LPRFRAAIEETIAAINTGTTPSGKQVPAKAEVRDPTIRAALDDVVQQLVVLRATFDDLLRKGEIRPCGCQAPDCPVYMLSDQAAREMDRRRRDLLFAALKINPDAPAVFYEMA